jgi:heavy metal sensor kinase
MMMQALSIRARLTLWYLAVTFTALLFFGLLSLGALRYTLLKLKRESIVRREQRLSSYLEQNRLKRPSLPLSDQLQDYALISHEGNFFQIRDLSGGLVFPLQPTSAAWLQQEPWRCSGTTFENLTVEGNPMTVMCDITSLDGRQVRLYIGSSLEDDDHILKSFRNAILFMLPCLLGLAATTGYFLSKQAMRPVDRMTKAAVSIGIGNLSSRLPVPLARDELHALAIAWNQLLDRLEGAVARLSKFSADSSHDLRTSITVILGTAQLSLRRRRSEDEYRSDLDKIVGECRTASTLLDALLSLARSDNFVHEVAFKRIAVGEMVIGGCRRVEDLAESSGILLDWRLPAEELFVQGDELLLQRLFGILLDNAIKYTPESGQIIVEVASKQNEVIVSVRDTGIGMTEEVREHVFDRYYQAELRERKTQAGSGLGLAIAHWIAEAHRAELSVKSSPMQGSEFQIRFPVLAAGTPANQAHAA